MDLEKLLSYNWGVMMPEFIILGVATLLCIIDLFMPANVSRRRLGWVAIIGVLLATFVLLGLVSAETTSILYDTFRLDSFAKAFKFILLVGAALVLLLAESYQPAEGMKETRGEFYYLFLAALLGAMVMTSSGDLITMFVGLELLSVSSYILAGIRKDHLASNESAMKYVINGGISTAITLFGMSYLYGLTGTTNLKEMGLIMSQTLDGQHLYLYGIAFFMVLVGLSFKIAAAPFHMWAPDVYQGAPTPVTAFLSVLSKTAGFIIILRVIIYLFLNASGDEIGALGFMEKNRIFISCLAGITMIFGNVVALRQKNMKRLLAYSSIAHAGYLLVSVATLGYFTPSTVWFYLVAYVFMSLGAFAVIQYMADRTGSDEIASFAGLYKRAPFLAIAMGIFLLSMAGIPGTAGFVAKLNIFMGTFAVDPSHYVLASILIGTTVISYFYYFSVMVQMFFRSAENQADFTKVKLPIGILIVLVVCVIGTIGFGIVPGAALDFLYGNFGDFEDFLQ
ncbi:NADH-quinone oxidoreductase subunit NuoN [Bacillus massiliigorillae]|uniref:NADH-quinone oxidoreductase subunit NuoN n=1 Tax=Bacillus massiliigorillae TaxID=1243664 RepID=UPI00039D3A51|nr:NADH-quinone oxidoreductase subunit NuoN [Bacillus massiliigorillae]